MGSRRHVARLPKNGGLGSKVTIEDDITYWRQCMENAPSKEAAMLGFAVETGLKLANADHVHPLRQALDRCITVAPSVMTGEAAIDRLKEINVFVYRALERT